MESSDKLDMDLDTIIKLKKVTVGPNPRNRHKKGGSGPGKKNHQPVRSPANNATMRSNKIVVSNLAPSVSDDDVRELFKDSGDIRYYALHHDRCGRR